MTAAADPRVRRPVIGVGRGDTLDDPGGERALLYTEAMVTAPLPPDVAARLETLGDAIGRSCPAVMFVYLFGSMATGTSGPRSDVDVAVYVDPAADAAALRLDALRAATRHLATDAVDLVVLNDAPIALAGRVLTSRRVLLDRAPYLRHRYESRVMRLFHDFRIRERRLLDQRFAHGRP